LGSGIADAPHVHIGAYDVKSALPLQIRWNLAEQAQISASTDLKKRTPIPGLRWLPGLLPASFCSVFRIICGHNDLGSELKTALVSAGKMNHAPSSTSFRN
jgi:hypothetical protein